MATNIDNAQPIRPNDVGRSDKQIVSGTPQGTAYAVAATGRGEGFTLAEWLVRYTALGGTVHGVAQCVRSDATWFAAHPAAAKGARRGTMHVHVHVAATKGAPLACRGGHAEGGSECGVTVRNIGDGAVRVHNTANGMGDAPSAPAFDGDHAMVLRLARERLASVEAALKSFGAARIAATPSIASVRTAIDAYAAAHGGSAKAKAPAKARTPRKAAPTAKASE
jgi:hypothetical protein